MENPFKESTSLDLDKERDAIKYEGSYTRSFIIFKILFYFKNVSVHAYNQIFVLLCVTNEFVLFCSRLNTMV